MVHPNKVKHSLESPARFVFPAPTRETAVPKKRSRPDGTVKLGCDTRADGRLCTLCGFPERAPVCSVTLGGLSGAFTSRAVSIAGRASRLQSYSLGSESGEPELPEGLRTGGEVHDPAADGSPEFSLGGELHLTFVCTFRLWISREACALNSATFFIGKVKVFSSPKRVVRRGK